MMMIHYDDDDRDDNDDGDDDDDDDDDICTDSYHQFSSLGIDWSWNPVTSSASPDGAVKRAQLALSIAKKQLGE